jgi:hypothetical protein
MNTIRMTPGVPYNTIIGDRGRGDYHKQLAILKEYCPENFGPCGALVAAEIARIEGQELYAERLHRSS